MTVVNSGFLYKRMKIRGTNFLFGSLCFHREFDRHCSLKCYPTYPSSVHPYIVMDIRVLRRTDNTTKDQKDRKVRRIVEVTLTVLYSTSDPPQGSKVHNGRSE